MRLFDHKNIIRGGFGKYIDGGIDLPPIGFKGHFRVELISRAGIIKQCLEFDNLITDAGLNFCASGSTPLSFAAVGTGSTTPTTSDTTLQAEISPSSSNRTNANGSIADVYTYVSGTPDYHQRVKTYLFDFTQGNGNLTEIGLFNASSIGTMWTRQLFKDAGGTPTTIVKTSSDQLRVTYTLQAYPLQTDGSVTFTISGTSYTFTIRSAYVGVTSNSWNASVFDNPGRFTDATFLANSGSLPARTSGLNTGTSPSTNTTATYVAGNFYKDTTGVWNSSIANFGAGGINSFSCFGVNGIGGIQQFGVSPAFAKDNTKQLTLVIRNSWGRYP